NGIGIIINTHNKMTQKEEDTMCILKYIRDSKKSHISLTELKQYSGAEPLRVDAIMYEFYLSRIFQPSAYSFWGIPIEYIVPDESSIKKCENSFKNKKGK
ncbi:MAG: hypothetical protein RSC87_07635, partial [Muribaculaceae bacterium]